MKKRTRIWKGIALGLAMSLALGLMGCGADGTTTVPAASTSRQETAPVEPTDPPTETTSERATDTATDTASQTTSEAPADTTTDAPTETTEPEQSTSEPSDGPGTDEEARWAEDTSPVDLSWFVGASWYGRSWGEAFSSKYITEKTGVNIKIEVPAGEANEAIGLMMTSGELPDLISMGSWETNVRKLWEGGHVHALNLLADEFDPYFYQVAGDGTLKWYRQEDGNTYAMPNDSYSPNQMEETGMTAASQTFLVRKDLYEAIGSPDLSTPEGFIAALQTVHDDYAEYKGQPITAFYSQGNVQYGMTEYLQNLLAIPHEKDGEVYDRYTDPEYITWLKTFREAYEKGLIDVDFMVDSEDQITEKTNNARYFMMIREWNNMAGVNPILQAIDPDTYYVAVDGPLNSNGAKSTLFPGNMNGWMVTMISKSCEHPDRAIRFLSYMASEEGQRDIFMGKEGETFDIVDGKPQLKPELTDLLNSDLDAFEKDWGLIDSYWMLRNPVIVDQWRPEKVDIVQQLQDFANERADIHGGIYKDLDPVGDSDVAVIWQRIFQNWLETVPELITAESDERFDEIFNDFLARRDEFGFDQVMAHRNQELASRQQKLSD